MTQHHQTPFERFIERARRFCYEDYARNFGGIPEHVGDMLASQPAQALLVGARRHLEEAEPLPWGEPRLRRLEFGRVDDAPEFLNGDVAAVDGTLPLPLQSYSVGQAICVGIVSASLRREPTESAHCVTAAMLMDPQASTAGDAVAARDTIRHGLNATAFMRYFETLHALEIPERYVFLDGTLLYEWHLSQVVTGDLYRQLFERKVPMGIIKSIHDSNRLGYIGAVLEPGEVYIDQTVADHIAGEAETLREFTRRDPQFVVPALRPLTHEVWRGVFKPRHKAFGFEVHREHLEDMLRIAAASAHLDQLGHEIPYLLNLVDVEVRTRFGRRLLDQRLRQVLAERGLQSYFEELDERELRD
ncbi:MAG TPA: hypothetical protein VGJ60_33950 [Chloroflexota bacterium]